MAVSANTPLPGVRSTIASEMLARGKSFAAKLGYKVDTNDMKTPAEDPVDVFTISILLCLRIGSIIPVGAATTPDVTPRDPLARDANAVLLSVKRANATMLETPHGGILGQYI